jgi:protein involved in polysaccharide export with SLBB domain
VNTNPILRTLATCGVLSCLVMAGGCDVPSFIDPGELAGLRENSREPLVVKIVDSLDPSREEGNKDFASAQPPKPEDLISEPADYLIGPNDLILITINNLEQSGIQTVKQARVSGTGNITLPYLPNVVRAAGLTEIELQQAITDAYKKAQVVEEANASVSVTEARNRAYSVLGSVNRPGLYVITDENFRILDALTQAGDISTPFPLEDLYIIRQIGGEVKHAPMSGDAGAGPTTRPTKLEGPVTQPADELAPPQSNSRKLPKAMKKSVLLQAQVEPAEGPVVSPEIAAAEEDSAVRVGRIDGKEVVVEPGEAAAQTQAVADTMADTADSGKPFEFNEPPLPDNIRVIKIPLAKLRAGEYQWNIPVRPRDTIVIPPGQVGFYYMNGHVLTTGAYAFSGQKVTLMQAIAAARGLDGLAIPQRTEIVRRIGSNENMFYRVDLAKIFSGDAPDVYLKPNDQVLVGTNFLAPFLASIRGGFRMTYGFGFLYDKNFAYDDNNQNR